MPGDSLTVFGGSRYARHLSSQRCRGRQVVHERAKLTAQQAQAFVEMSQARTGTVARTNCCRRERLASRTPPSRGRSAVTVLRG